MWSKLCQPSRSFFANSLKWAARNCQPEIRVPPRIIMDNQYKIVTPDFVNVRISNSNNSNTICVERRFRKDITIADLRGKLEMLTGGNQGSMKIEVYDMDEKFTCSLENDSALLGSYPIDDGMRIHVVDKFTLRNQLTDDGNVEKYEMPLEEYAKRPDTVRAFLAKNKLGKFNAEEMKKREEDRLKEEAEEEATAGLIPVGSRCEVAIPGAALRRGAVKFVGNIDDKKGWWIGVHYDEPVGKNDGSVNGKPYFVCPPKYGGFVKPMYIKVGDYPEEELDLDEL